MAFRFHAHRFVPLMLAAALFPAGAQSPAPAVPAVTAPATPAAPVAATPAPAATAATVTAGAATRTVTAPTLTLPQQIAALPRLDNAGIDADARGKAIISHLNAVLRFYRESATQAQKVGEPSDVLYAEQATTQATQVAQNAFQSARNIAALLARLTPKGSAAPAPDAASDDDDKKDQPAEPTESQRLAAYRTQVQQRIADLTTQDAALDKQVASAKAADLPALRQTDQQVEGQLELQKAMLDALGKVATMADAQTTSTGLAGDIDRLLHTAPELATTTQKQVVAPAVIESLSEVHDSGVSSQAVALFQLLSTRHEIESRMADVDALRLAAIDMRTPMVKLLQSTIAQGDAAMKAAPGDNSTNADLLQATRKRYDTLSNTFRVLSTATLPVSQEIVLLEQTRANLVTWRAAVDAEYQSILRALLMRVLFIALALLALFIISEVWQRLTVKYVHDMRRRRQIMLIRRMVLGFVGGIFVIFGFVTQFSSLATFAGFITAGIAVGLQTILLSVAAYFFIVGRYGVRVGDRISVAGVTGDVIEVGLVRFYMMELTGTGTELHPTGRVVVFANSVLFQAGTPLYKQMPGTEYAWHELTVRLKPEVDYKPAMDAILKSVQSTYEGYRARIETQHRTVETWMDTALETPTIEARLQLADTGLQYAVLFPVEIKEAATTDEQLVQELLGRMAADAAVRDAVAASPVVKAVIKG